MKTKILSFFISILLVMYVGLSTHANTTIITSVTNDTICNGSSITIGNTYANGVLYYWTPSGNNTPQITVSPATNTQYIETVWNAALQIIYVDTFNIIVKAKPMIWCSGPTVICPGNQAQLIAHGANTYLWSNGMTNDTIIVYPTTNTTYSVIGTAINGCTDTANILVMVQSPPQPYAITGDSTYCAGQSGVVIGLNGSESDCYYKLYQNNVLVQTVNGTGFSITFGTYPAGTYISKGFKNTLGCSSPMNGSLHVVALPLPQAAGSINGLTTVCQHAVANYSTSVIANATSYDWSIPTGAMITSGQGTLNITVNFGTASSGDIKVRGHNACGDGSSTTLAVTVNVAPVLMVFATDTIICAGESVTLTANTNANTVVWNDGSTQNPRTVTLTTTTTYSVTATGTNGCVTTDHILITVNPLPNVSLVLTPDHFCTDQNKVALVGGLVNGSPFLGGHYTSSQGCVILNDTLYPPLSFVGTYNITYTFTNPLTGCSNFATDLGTINPVPAVHFYSILGDIRTDTPPFDLNNYVSPTGGKFWGRGILADSSSMFYPDSAGSGTHMISYKYTHPVTGCSAVQIQYIPVGAVGVEEIVAAVNAIEMFPNPADYQLILRNINTKEITGIKIINIFGETVSVTKTVTNMMYIDISSYPSGSYFIIFMDANGFSKGKMFMKR